MKYYFTFGFGTDKANCYTVIESDSYENARTEMIRRWGLKWAFQYSEKDWMLSPDDVGFRSKCIMHGIDPNRTEPITQAEMYGLMEIK